MQESAAVQRAGAIEVSKLLQPGLTQVIFCPETIPVSAMQKRETGLWEIPAFEFCLLRDLPLIGPDYSQAAFDAGEDMGAADVTPLARGQKCSGAIADELVGAYGDRGLVWIESLENVAARDIARLEKLLLPDGTPESLSQALAFLVTLDLENPQMEAARLKVIESLHTAMAWREADFNDKIAEQQRARQGKPGRAEFTASERAWFAQAGLSLPEDRHAEQSEISAEGSLTREEFFDLMQQQNRANAEIFADALVAAERRAEERAVQRLKEAKAKKDEK